MQIAKIDENWYKLQKLEVSISANLPQQASTPAVDRGGA